MKHNEIKLSDFNISPYRGFLPSQDPLAVLPLTLDFLDDFGNNLPELIESGQILTKARVLPIPPLDYFSSLNYRELQLVWIRYAFIQSAYVHYQAGSIASNSICPSIARPIWAISKLLNKPPILSYDAYVLNNWKRKDPAGGISVDNLELIQTFIRDSDQSWFNLIHVDIESRFSLRNLWDAHLSVYYGLGNLLDYFLPRVNESIKEMIMTMKRMPEGTSPDTYYKIRPWIMSFDNVVYRDVTELGEQLKSFRGQTGAQTSIFQSLEAGLQMPQLSENKLSVHLRDMRQYMPKDHRKFIEYLEKNSKVREFIISSGPYLIDLYDDCVMNVITFLAIHLGYAFYYIHKQTGNPKGTGGTDFMDYLGGRIKERWERAFIEPRSEADFKLFKTNVGKAVRELIGA